MSSGYFYRLLTSDAGKIRELAQQMPGLPCQQIRATSLWDLDGLPQLDEVKSCTTAEEIILTGDFGHLFNMRAELRWKRRDDGSYDVLVLTESELVLPGASLIASGWPAQEKQLISQGGSKPDTQVVVYQAPNGAVQLLRYKEVPR